MNYSSQYLDEDVIAKMREYLTAYIEAHTPDEKPDHSPFDNFSRDELKEYLEARKSASQGDSALLDAILDKQYEKESENRKKTCTEEELRKLKQEYCDARDAAIEPRISQAVALPAETKKKKRKTIAFNPYLWSDHPAVNECTRKIVETLCRGHIPTNVNRGKFYATAKIIFLNLYRTHMAGEDKWVAFSLNKNRIDVPRRYRRSGINYEHLKLIIDALFSLGLIEFEQGFHDRSRYSGTKYSWSKPPVMRPDGIKDMFGVIKPEHIIRNPKQELIELKAAPDKFDKKRLIRYKDTERTRRRRKVLRTYNQLIKESEIKLIVLPKSFVDFSDITVKRVFNNRSWSQGGRFYGGWWLDGIKSKARHDITINGNPTVELDYKALHPFMLYQQEGIKLDFDPYTLTQYDNHPEKKKIRNLVKDMLLIWLNAIDEPRAMFRLKQDIEDDRKADERRYPDNIPDIEEVAEGFSRLNAPIAKHFFSGIGIRLQFKDSCIAERIIKSFAEQGKVVLCLHDGFRCEADHEEELRQLMGNYYMQEMGIDYHPVIDIKNKG